MHSASPATRKTPPTPAEAPEVLARLRAETRTAHLRLHDHPLLAPLPRGAVGPNAYACVLAAFHGFYAGWRGSGSWPVGPGQSTLVAELAAAIDARVGWLAADLASLGIGAADLPSCTDLVPPDDDAGAAGGLYVVEGSALGGSTIARRLAASAPSPIAAATRFFTGRGAATGARWADARTLIAAACATSANADAAVVAANATFAGLEAWLWQRWHDRHPIPGDPAGDAMARRCS